MSNGFYWAPVIGGGAILCILVAILARGELVRVDGKGTEKIKLGKLELQTSRLALLFLLSSAMVSLPLLLAHFKPEPPLPVPTICPPSVAATPERITLFINGEVLDQNNNGLSDARIQVFDSNQKLLTERTSDEDGLFTFPPLDVKTQGQQLTIKTFKENYFQQQVIIGPSASVKLHSVLMPRKTIVP